MLSHNQIREGCKTWATWHNKTNPTASKDSKDNSAGGGTDAQTVETKGDEGAIEEVTAKVEEDQTTTRTDVHGVVSSTALPTLAQRLARRVTTVENWDTSAEYAVQTHNNDEAYLPPEWRQRQEVCKLHIATHYRTQNFKTKHFI